MKKRKRLFKHHIVPKSRGGKINGNIALIGFGDHADYHKLFGNATPDEIIERLIDYFWGGKWEIAMNALKTYLNKKGEKDEK